MSLGVTNELRAEVGAQAIRFGVQQGFNELSAFALIQVDRPITGYPLELVDNLCQRMSGILGAGGNGIRPISRDHENAAARQTSAEVEEEADRTGIGPL